MTEDVQYEIVDDCTVAVFNRAISNYEMAQKIARLKRAKNKEDPFFVINLTALVERFMLWNEKLPRIQPFYAVKCNNNPLILRVLAELGAGFDCASKTEIDQIVSLGLTPVDRILYANPCKTRSFVNYASILGIRKMTFDSAEELIKIQTEHPNPQLILRIAIGDPNAQCPLSVKFGCDPPLIEGPKLLKLAKKLKISIIGISFHVGSGCNTPGIFRDAILISRQLFDIGKSLGHTNMHVLDIGGGFPGFDSQSISFNDIVDVINSCLNEYFPVDSNVEIIAEPGRFFAAEPAALITNVIARTRVPASRITKKEVDQDRDGFMYYINDGVYGSFNCILFDHFQPRGVPLCLDEPSDLMKKKHPTTIWGPTCDGLDQVEAITEMQRLTTGDWIFYQHMGAYTSAAATKFNGFELPKTYYVIDKVTWQTMFEINDKLSTFEDSLLKKDVY